MVLARVHGQVRISLLQTAAEKKQILGFLSRDGSVGGHWTRVRAATRVEGFQRRRFRKKRVCAGDSRIRDWCVYCRK